MLLTSGIIALSRKVADDKAKKKEARQGVMKVGDSDVAKRAFGAQTSNRLEAGDVGVKRAGTEIKFEDPSDVDAGSPSTITPTVSSSDTKRRVLPPSSPSDVASPAKSEKGYLDPASPHNETPTTFSSLGGSSTTLQPPPYSPRAESSTLALSPTISSRDPTSDSLATADTRSISTRSTNSNGTHAIRVKTKGADLKSGFPYHPALFDLRVHPDRWTAFTEQIIQSTKFGFNDHARVWAAATGVAFTGFIGTSVYVGKTMKRTVQEKKVKAGLTDESDGGLGDTLKQWNEEYFNQLGLFVHLELSESAMKNPDQKSNPFRKHSLMYSKREDRERKKDERKYVIVVTKLDEDGNPSEAIHELAGTEDSPVEIAGGEDPKYSVAEMPGDEGSVPVELPAEMPSTIEKESGQSSGYVEMDGHNTFLLEKMSLDASPHDRSAHPEKDLVPQPLSVASKSWSPVEKEPT